MSARVHKDEYGMNWTTHFCPGCGIECRTQIGTTPSVSRRRLAVLSEQLLCGVCSQLSKILNLFKVKEM